MTETTSMRERLARALSDQFEELLGGFPLTESEADKMVDAFLSALAEPTEGVDHAVHLAIRDAATSGQATERAIAAMIQAIREGA